jgi:5'-nucleotidase (lipoprotein e(P4) family)
MRPIIALLLFTLTACATATTPTPTPTSTPMSTPPAAPTVAETAPCDPGHSILNGTLWMQTSAEYRAVAFTIFANARSSLDAQLRNPFAKAATEETTNDPTQPPAIILDLDETILDNGAFESRAIRAHKTYDATLWKAWTAEGAARAIPGAKDFLDYAKAHGVTVFYITNRDASEEPGTRRNLEQLGFPFDPKVDTLLMQGKNGWTTSDKSPRRAFVAATYHIAMILGDDLNDFMTAAGKTLAERNALVDSVRGWWGDTWFILPNPMYGSWERAVIGPGGTPCEQLQRKVDALR